MLAKNYFFDGQYEQALETIDKLITSEKFEEYDPHYL